mgnify:CR=1 FL=1
MIHGGAAASGALVLAIMVAVGLFLSIQAMQALRRTGLSFLTTTEWQPDSGKFGIAAVLFGTVLIAAAILSLSGVVTRLIASFRPTMAPCSVRLERFEWHEKVTQHPK